MEYAKNTFSNTKYVNSTMEIRKISRYVSVLNSDLDIMQKLDEFAVSLNLHELDFSQ